MWLLEPSVERDLRVKFKAVGQPSAHQLEQFNAALKEAEVQAATDGRPRNLRVAGDVAEISIKGVLTEKVDFILWLFGIDNTSYEQINAALAVAASDPTVKRVVLNVDSPGGQVKGLFETFAALDAFQKPKSVRASLAASAAYGIAALGGNIEATNPAATFGSVGVVASYFLDEELIEITSTEAPNKRPDPSTDEGKAVIREYLDAVHQLFAEAIARGRGTTVEDVNANFGRGGIVLAADAKKRGMIDKVPPALRAVKTGARAEAQAELEPENPIAAPVAAQQQGKKHMDLQTLKAQHPDTYAAAFAEGKDKGLEEGREAGTTAERKRVSAHLKMGETTGATEVAFKAIREGSAFADEEIQAEYMSASMNRRDQNVRQTESDEAGAVVDGAGSATAQNGGAAGGGDLGDQVVAVLQSKFGKKGAA